MTKYLFFNVATTTSSEMVLVWLKSKLASPLLMSYEDMGGNNVARGGTDGSCDGRDEGCSFLCMSPIPSLCRTLGVRNK